MTADDRRILSALLLLGLVLRVVLAWLIVPGQGFAADLAMFDNWATNLAAGGPGSVYGSVASLNYPPGYLWILWPIGVLGHALAGLLGTSPALATGALLKIPAIAADLAIAWLVAGAAGRWFGSRAGLVAAALYLFVPVTWYDSALWGQVDAVGALVMLIAVLLLIDGWSEAALAVAVVATLIKPQDAIVLAVVAPILVRRHLLRPGSGPVPVPGRRLAAIDARLGYVITGLVHRQGVSRLVTSALAGLVVGLVILAPFDIEIFAPSRVATIPVVAPIAGVMGLVVRLGGEFSVLTANAFNGWALVGPTPLSTAIGSGGDWTTDATLVIGGVNAAKIGVGMLGLVVALVVGGLLLRDHHLPILLGLAVLAFAFYALPTRVHERYLVPFFAVGAVLASGSLVASAAYIVTAVFNAINLHAVLAGNVELGGPAGPQGGPGGPPLPASNGGFTAIQLPFGDLARSPAVVTIAAIGQSVVMAILIVAWLVLIVRGPDPVASDDSQPSLADLAG